ncbi:unnamed protein product [Calicophoron daubneyi]|uniref:Uncharacterized protein n=1 Tax=Calicophoron daubneyi TaxID=300641 RepID=A0AAV2TBN3_CALDB
MSYEGLINVPFVPSDFGQSYCSGILENCSLGNVDSSLDYRVSNCDCELRAFITSPWLKQYRSMCVELGRAAQIYEGNVWKPSLTTVHDTSRARALRHTNPPNSVGHKVFSFLREAFRKTSEEVKFHESSQIRRLEKHKDVRRKKEPVNARAQKIWHPTSHWISKKKSKSMDVTKPLGFQRSITEGTKILQIKHSGTRSADYLRRHQNASLERARTSTPILIGQANSQNSTPSARPSALITEKSRDGISKRTRFSLHPSTCNAPPDLIRPRRDSEETSNSVSSIPEFPSRSARSSSHQASPTSLPASFQAMPVGGAAYSNVEVVVPSVNSDRTNLRISNDSDPRPSISYCKSNAGNDSRTKIIRNSASFELPMSPDEGLGSHVESTSANETITTDRLKIQDALSDRKDEAPLHTMPLVRVTPNRTNDVPLAKVIPQNYCVRETRREIAVAHSVPSKHRASVQPAAPNLTVRRGYGRQPEHKVCSRVSAPPEKLMPSQLVLLEGDPISSRPLTSWMGRSRASKSAPVRIAEVQKYPRLLSDVNQIHRTCVAPTDLSREPTEGVCQNRIAECGKTSLPGCFDSATKGSNPVSSKNKSSWGDPRRPTPALSSGKNVVYANPQLHVPEIIKSTRTIENSDTPNMRANLQGMLNSENPLDSNIITLRSLDDCLDVIPTREFSSLSVERGETRYSHCDPPKVENRCKLKRSASFSPANSMGERVHRKERYIMHTLVVNSEEVDKLDPIPERLVGTTVASKAFCKEIESLLRPAVVSSYTKSKPNFPLRETRDFSTSTENNVSVVCHGTQTGSSPASSGRDLSSNPSLFNVFPHQQKFAQITLSPTILDSFTDRLTTLSTSSVVQHPSSSVSLLGGEESDQKSHEQPDGLSTLTLWNQIRHSLVELSSISEEGGLPPPKKQATATVQLERSLSAMARTNTTGSLSPCVSRVGTDLSELNADVTGLSEPTLSSLSVPENFGSEIPWTRAKLVMLPGTTIKSARSTPAAVLTPCQLVSRSSQTYPTFIELPSEIVFNKGDLYCVQRTPAEFCQKTAIRTRNSSSQISMRSPVRVDNSASSSSKSEKSASTDNISKPSLQLVKQPPVSQGSEIAVQTETVCCSPQMNVVSPLLSRSFSQPVSKYHSPQDAPENCTNIPHGNNISAEASPANRKDIKEKPKILKYPNMSDYLPAYGNRIPGSYLNQMPDKLIPLSGNPVLGREMGRISQLTSSRRNTRRDESRSESGRLTRSASRRTKYEEPQRKFLRPKHKTGDKENVKHKPKWNSVYSPNHRRMPRGSSRRWRYGNPGGETDTSDFEENSPFGGVRRSFPRPARTKRIHYDDDFSSENRSQVPSFEVIRLQRRKKETAYLPVKPGVMQPRANKGFKEPKSNSFSKSSPDNRKIAHHSSMPHLLRIPSMYTPESPRAQVWNRLTSQGQPQCQAHRSSIQNEKTKEFRKAPTSLQIRKYNSRRPKYKVQRNSTVCEDPASFRISTPHHTFPHPSEHDRNLEPRSQRRLVKRLNTFDACNNDACLISTPSLRRGSLSFHNSAGYNTANTQDCERYLKKLDPFLGFHAERRTEDNLLRHTFASLQKVRTKAPQMMPVNSRPPMVFK